MQNEKLQINFAEGETKKELIIREVNSVNELPVKPPIKIKIDGTIDSVAEFLSKRRDQEDQINQKRCYVLVNRELICLELVISENDEYHRGSVKGTLSQHPAFVQFGINSGKVRTTELGMFFKMNRAFFTNKDENMKLVSELMNFTATVNNSIERSAKENGDRSDKFAQTVNSNLPPAFDLEIPVFRGMPSEKLEVETFARIDGREVSFILLSPAANQTIEEIRDSVIDKEIEKIKVLCPDIAIIEQ